MAAFSCDTEALMLGSLMMLASGDRVSLPSAARLSGARCSSLRYSGNWPRTRPATEMSLVCTSMPATLAKLLTMGSSEAVARRGASSVRV